MTGKAGGELGSVGLRWVWLSWLGRQDRKLGEVDRQERKFGTWNR